MSYRAQLHDRRKKKGVNPLLPVTLILAPIVAVMGYQDFKKDQAANQITEAMLNTSGSSYGITSRERAESELRYKHMTGLYTVLWDGYENKKQYLQSDGKHLRWEVEGEKHKAKHIGSKFTWNDKTNRGVLERKWITDKITLTALITYEMTFFYYEHKDFPGVEMPWLRRIK